MNTIFNNPTLWAVAGAIIVMGLPLAIWLATWLLGLRYIPHSSVGIIEKFTRQMVEKKDAPPEFPASK